MNGSNIDPRNSIHRSPLRGTYLLIAGLLAGFGLFIALALAGFGVLSRAQATNALPPPDPALTGNFGRMFRNLPPLPRQRMRFAMLLWSSVDQAGLWMRTTISQQARWR